MSGFQTKQHLWDATAFVDHLGNFVYVHLMRDLYLAKTLLGKEAMEKVMTQDGRSIKHYHADNERFSDNGFVDAVNIKSQKLTFRGVGAHYQMAK